MPDHNPLTRPLSQQRRHAPRPGRDIPRASNTEDHLAGLAPRLTPRDRWIVRMVHEHRVLTTHQIEQMAFPSPLTARRRLIWLYRQSLLDRFHPYLASGNLPWHYILGASGASWLAGEFAVEPRDLGFRHRRMASVAASPTLAHQIGCNDWFTALVASARYRPGTRLEAWWSETRCVRLFGDRVRPDGYGRYLTEHGRRIEFFLEYDMGTESLNRLAAKLPGYARLAAATAVTTPLLLWVPSVRREHNVRDRLQATMTRVQDQRAVPIATAAAGLLDDNDLTTGPAERVWLPLHPTHVTGRGTGRGTLADLADLWPFLPPSGEPDGLTDKTATTTAGDGAARGTAADARRGLPAIPPSPPPL